MTEYRIFESPKREKRRSAPIAAGSPAEQTLRARGWRLVETVSDETLVEVVDTTPELPDQLPPAYAPIVLDRAGLTDAQFQALVEAGYADADVLRAATDEDLRAVEGIGPAAVRNLRKALAEGWTE